MNEQIKLIKEDINFIEKYYGTDNFNGLINDMLLHLKAVENQIAAYKDKEDKIRNEINCYYKSEPAGAYSMGRTVDCILQILNDKVVE